MLHHKYISIETSLNPHPGVVMFVMLTILMVWYMLLSTFRTLMLQLLQNGNTMTISWEYKKFLHSCQHIFHRPMAHVMSGKVKTNMFLIWCGPDIEDIYDNFQLDDDKMYDIDDVMEQFEQYCEPICNFRTARYKFHQVSQHENGMTNAFYHHIQKLCIQCQFSDDEELLVDAIICGTKVQKAWEKLLQVPKHLTLHDCLKICCHDESLQYHLNVVKPTDKPVESIITKHHFNRGGRQQSTSSKKSGTIRSHPSDKPSNSAKNTTQCRNCNMTHAKNQCPAYHITCFKCNRVGHFASVCRSSSSSTQNTRQFNRFLGRGRAPWGRGFTPR